MHFLKRFWQHRSNRVGVWILLAIPAVIALLWSWVDWSGARSWRQARAMLAREGQPLDFRAVAPDPIPDADNFCAIPMLKDITIVIDDDGNKGAPGEKRARLNAACLPPYDQTAWAPKLTGAGLGRRADLKRFAAWMRVNGWPFVQDDLEDFAHDMLAAFSTHDLLYRELASGLDRPGAQWTPAWKTRALSGNLALQPLPHYGPANGLNRSLALRCIAAARAGDAPKAHESVQLMAKLNQACLNEPLVVGLLVSARGTTALANATWELCDAQAGTADEFSRLESALAGMDFRQSACRAFSGDFTSAVDMIQFMKGAPDQRRAELAGIVNGRAANQTHAIRSLPQGFFDANTAVLADQYFVHVIKPLRDHGWQEALKGAHENEAALKEAGKHLFAHPTFMMSEIFEPAATAIIERAIYAQTLVNQSAIACALERYRIEKGSYPDSLDLVQLTDGKALPMDIMTGKPMGYRKTANGKYALWCVSLNGQDHGGTRALDKRRPENTKFWKDTYAGDWVWDFPER